MLTMLLYTLHVGYFYDEAKTTHRRRLSYVKQCRNTRQRRHPESWLGAIVITKLLSRLIYGSKNVERSIYIVC